MIAAALALTLGAGVAVSTQPPARVPPRGGGPTTAKACTTECHQNVTRFKSLHGPAQDCATCHVQGNPAEHKFFLITKKEDLCRKCHVIPRGSVVHVPFAEGQCLQCHNPHGSDHPALLVADPRRDLCGRCHQQDFAGAEFVHGPVVVGACVVCHEPHSSAHPKLLNQESREQCLTCHGEVLDTARASPHVHQALDQACTKCHNPHASSHRYHLQQAAPELCMTCHKDRIDQMTSHGKFVHGAITEQGGCSACHEGHASRLPSLQRTTQPNACLVCHDRALKTADGRTLTNMAALLEQNPTHHGPIREGVCTACHNPHAGDHFSMLVEEYPPEFYASFKLDTFGLCFKCHIPDLVLKSEGRGLTGFRNGNENLHWLHVNQEKGRTCRACHEVHASRRPAHIREAVPFGTSGWMLEINFEQTARGGTCAPACHKVRDYDRGDAVPVPAALGSGATR